MVSAKEAKANGNHVTRAADESSGESSLVLQALSKRLRNARKRLRGIDDIQAKVEAGKPLNADQASFSILSWVGSIPPLPQPTLSCFIHPRSLHFSSISVLTASLL